MKYLLSLIVLILPNLSFAQLQPFQELVLFTETTTVGEGSLAKIAKLKLTLNQFDRLKNEELLMYCKTTIDSDIIMVMYDAMFTVFHKKADKEYKKCDNYMGCRSDSGFDSLSSSLKGVTHQYGKAGDNQIRTFFIGSPGYYNKYKKEWALRHYPREDELKYVVFYNPNIHTKQTIPKVDTFYCFFKTRKDVLIAID